MQTSEYVYTHVITCLYKRGCVSHDGMIITCPTAQYIPYGLLLYICTLYVFVRFIRWGFFLPLSILLLVCYIHVYFHVYNIIYIMFIMYYSMRRTTMSSEEVQWMPAETG